MDYMMHVNKSAKIFDERTHTQYLNDDDDDEEEDEPILFENK